MLIEVEVAVAVVNKVIIIILVLTSRGGLCEFMRGSLYCMRRLYACRI